MNPKTQPLIDAHLAHVLTEMQKPDVINDEVQALLTWFGQNTVAQLVSKDAITNTINRLVTEQGLQPALIDEVGQIIQSALASISKHERTLGKTFDESQVKALIHTIATQDKIRARILEKVFANPTYASMLSQTITQAVEGYVQNNVIAKKVPGMGGLMKMGKGLLEKATDTNLDDALQQYLNKNINHLIQVSEQMANRHISNESIESFLLKMWNKTKDRTLREKDIEALKPHIEKGTKIAAENWDQLRQRQHFKTILNEGIDAWYARHQNDTFLKVLNDLNISSEGVKAFIDDAAIPALKHAVDSGYAASRIKPLLAAFYEGDAAQKILDAAN